MSDRFSDLRARQAIQSLCYSGLDPGALRRELLQRLKPLLRFDGCSLMTMDPATLMVTSAVTSGPLPPARARALFTNEYLEADFNKLADLARAPRHAAILTQATEGDPLRSQRYRELLAPLAGFGHELRATFVIDDACWGAALIYRHLDREPFTPIESGLIESLGPHIAAGLRSGLLLAQALAPQGPDGPGLLLLDEEARLLSISEPAERYLHGLGEEWRSRELPAPIYGLAAQARALAQGARGAPPGGNLLRGQSGYVLGGCRPARLRIPTGQGDWLAFHATTLSGPAGHLAIIVERARPAEVAPLLFEAYGLTPREQEVAQRILAGFSTREISDSLFISEHTVQDHVKAIFTKTGVSSRRELGGRIFFDSYFPKP